MGCGPWWWAAGIIGLLIIWFWGWGWPGAGGWGRWGWRRYYDQYQDCQQRNPPPPSGTTRPQTPTQAPTAPPREPSQGERGTPPGQHTPPSQGPAHETRPPQG